MKLPAKIVIGLLPFFLTACIHKTQQGQVQPLAPPIEDNPPPPPSTASVNLPPPVVTIPTEPTKTAPTLPPKPPAKHKKKPNNGAPATTPANSTTQDAANPSPNPGVSAIGQLSSGDPEDFRKDTEDSIAATEHGLNGITRTLSDTEQKTAEHIRDFLKQAKTALASGDVDGAHTLAAKAKVLLDELIQ
jgi:outer membrane biosynthesis protein TonB